MMYKLSYHAEEVLLLIETRGFWTMDVFRAYEAELASLLIRILADQNHFDILSNSLEFEVQSKEVSAAFDRLVNSSLIENNRG